MPYEESSADPSNALYEISIVDGDGRGLEFSARAGNHPAAVYESVFQNLVTLLEGSETVFNGAAKRTFGTTQQVTPSNAP